MNRLKNITGTLIVAAALVAAGSAGAAAQSPRESGGGGGGASHGGDGGSVGGGGGSATHSGGGAGGGAGSPGSSSGGSWGGATGSPSGSGGAWGGGRRQGEGRGVPRPRAGEGKDGQAVPWYSRPRGDNPPVGNATPRIPGDGGSGGYPPSSCVNCGGGWNGSGYYPYYGWGSYSPYYGWGSLWGCGGWGLGYFYDPYWWTCGLPGYYGYDAGYGIYGSGYGGYGGGYSYANQRLMGGLRLKVKPNQATVYVDGYYAGRVDDFDGMFQRLVIEEGPHKIEMSAPGYQRLAIDVSIRAFENITFQGELEPIR